MNPLSGLLSIPHRSEFKAQVGSFFSATIVANPKPGQWIVQIGSHRFEAHSTLLFEVGQKISLQTVKSDQAILFRIVSPQIESQVPDTPPLIAAFMAQGLPLIADRLRSWERKLGLNPTSSEVHWAGQTESKDAQNAASGMPDLQDWVDWERALERGSILPSPPPEGDDRFELWNAKKSKGSIQEILLPMSWTWEDRIDRGLLRARYAVETSKLLSWSLQAVAANIPFRLNAILSSPSELQLLWRFFRSTDATNFRKDINFLEETLNGSRSKVSIKVVGPDEQEDRHARWKSVDEIV